MTKSLIFPALALAVFAGSAAQSAQRIPLPAAIAQCQEQKKWDQGDIIDGATETTRADRVNQHFRACVYAKSGQYPATARRSGISISGTASIGVIVKN